MKAEGNPLFAEEIASFLVEQRIVRNVDSELQYQPSAVAAALPGTLELLLTAMVDRLKPEDRSLLQVASIIGRQFDLSLLAAATAHLKQGRNQSLAAIEPDRRDLSRRSIGELFI